MELDGSILSRMCERYRVLKIPKSRGRTRTIHAPDDELKQAQGLYLINESRSGIGAGPFAKGFVRSPRPREDGSLPPPIGVRGHALAHVGKKYVFEVDLKDFFHHVTPTHLVRTWRDYEGLSREEIEARFRPINPERIDRLAPPAGLAHLAFLPGHKLGKDLFGEAGLPQGSPLSPYLSNVAFKPIDFSINAYLRAMFGEGNYAYTRYADNLVISSDSGSVKVLKRLLVPIIESRGFPVNTRKFRFMKHTQRQSVCGVVVNEKPNFRKRLRYRYRGMIWRLFKMSTMRVMPGDGGLVPIRDWDPIIKHYRHVEGMMSYARDVAPSFYDKYEEPLKVIRICLSSVCQEGGHQ